MGTDRYVFGSVLLPTIRDTESYLLKPAFTLLQRILFNQSQIPRYKCTDTFAHCPCLFLAWWFDSSVCFLLFYFSILCTGALLRYLGDSRPTYVVPVEHLHRLMSKIQWCGRGTISRLAYTPHRCIPETRGFSNGDFARGRSPTD